MDAQMITAAALDVLDEAGLDKLSMRMVAAKLGVQVGGLYYYLPDKAALLRSMADQVCRQALHDFDALPAAAPDSSTGWQVSAAELCGCVHATLLAHRDTARVLATAPLNGSMGALALMDRLIALLDPGVEAAAIAADTLMAYVTGFVLQQQAELPPGFSYPVSLDELRASFPRVFRSIDIADDDNFRAAIEAILNGFAHSRDPISACPQCCRTSDR